MKKIILTGIGADIEVFVRNKTTDKITTAEGAIRGDKYNPYIPDPLMPMFSTSLDNVLAEFTIPPATNREEFFNYIKKGVGLIDQQIGESNLCVAILQSHEMDIQDIMTENGQRFGCEPDFNAYLKTINMRPHAVEFTLRSAGGHIHIGYEDPLPYAKNVRRYVPDDERSTIIKALDLFIGVPSVLLEPDNKRKLLYGKAGAFRPKPYGVEYRTLSNYYLQDEKLTKNIYDSTVKAIDWLNDGNTITNDLEQQIVHSINNNDKNAAQELVNTFNLQLA